MSRQPHILYAHASRLAGNIAPEPLQKTLSVLMGSDQQPVSGQTAYGLVNPSAQDMISAETEAFLQEFVGRAHTAADSLACGSILAGHTSEADDYGDVAVFLGPGDFGPGQEHAALQALALDGVLQSPVQPLALSSESTLPNTVSVPSAENEYAGNTAGEFCGLLRQLENVHAFYISGDRSTYFLFGRLASSHGSAVDEAVWVGLAGVGVTGQ